MVSSATAKSPSLLSVDSPEQLIFLLNNGVKPQGGPKLRLSVGVFVTKRKPIGYKEQKPTFWGVAGNSDCLRPLDYRRFGRPNIVIYYNLK